MSSQGLDAYLDIDDKDPSRVARSTASRMLSYAFRHPGPLFGGTFLLLLGTGASLLEPWLFGYAIDAAIVPKDWPFLRVLVVVVFAVMSVRTLSGAGTLYLFTKLGQKVGQDLRLEVFSHLERLPVRVYDKNPAARLMTRATNDVAALDEMFASGIVTLGTNALTVVGIMAWLLWLNLKLGLLAASVLPFLIVLTVYFSKKLTMSYREARSKFSALNAFLAENILGMKVVQLFNRQSVHLERFDRVNQWNTDAQVGTIKIMALFNPMITVCAATSVALVIGFGGASAMRGEITIGVLVAYFSYVLSLFHPMREIADKWSTFLSGMASAERIFSVLGWTPELEAQAVELDPAAIEGIKGEIRFENVWFAYDQVEGQEHWVLKDFSLVIQEGSRLGVVGHTGAGKTTLISLLMRFYEPQRGRILLDGKDLKEYDRRALRASIGIIQQDAFLFSGTMEENITLWKEDAQGRPVAIPEDAKETLDALGLHANWRKRELEERGSNVSIGEKQVIAFARALAARPKIWILDEATANMDSRSEEVLQKSLDIASSRRTSILIAHRLSTVKTSDKIVVLHKGSLIEQGTHAELLAIDGMYARLYRYQRAQHDAEAVAGAPLASSEAIRTES
jgi:ATP-binding cassette subfamily B multidrug efflux pump